VLPDDNHRSKHVGAFNVLMCVFRIIQYILVHLLVLITDGLQFINSLIIADYVVDCLVSMWRRTIL
jgi:hypothetical protein